MRRAKILLVNNEEIIRRAVERILQGRGFDVESWPIYKGINAVKKGRYNAIILDQKSGLYTSHTTSPQGIFQARELAEDKNVRDIPRFLLTETDTLDNKRDALVADGIFKDIIYKSDAAVEDRLKDKIGYHTVIPLKIGFISLGRLAQGLIKTLLHTCPENIESITGVSVAETKGHDEASLRERLSLPSESDFRICSSLEEFIALDNDINVVSSSKLAKSRLRPGRNWLWRIDQRTLVPIYQKIVEVERRLRQQGQEVSPLYNIATNPIGSQIMLGIELGLDPQRITGLSASDTYRVIEWIKKRYKDLNGVWPDQKKVYARVLNQHGLEIPVIGSIIAEGRTAKDLGLDCEEERLQMIEDIRKTGGKKQQEIRDAQEEDRYELVSSDVAEAFVQNVREISKREQPSWSSYSLREKDGLYCAYNGPQIRDYDQKGLRVLPAPLDTIALTPEERIQIDDEFIMSSEFQVSRIEKLLGRLRIQPSEHAKNYLKIRD